MALRTYIEKCVCILIVAAAFSHPTEAQTPTEPVAPSAEEEGRFGMLEFKDRWAVKTNAFEWLLTVPNIGVEFDLKNSEYNAMTLGLTAKYNWNTYHMNADIGRYAPYNVFNLFDVRPEFRYYYRTRKPVRGATEGWTVEKFLKDRKHPKTWRAQFVGAYVNYASYALKLGDKGNQGTAIGFGATAGYGIPMYEYRNGFIDIELGFSVGLQVADKNIFRHNPEGFTYTEVEGGRGMRPTPFPVLSELKVAFVWRHKSIKDKVKEDAEKAKVKRHYEMQCADFAYPFKEDHTKEKFDEYLVNMEKTHLMKVDTAYRNAFGARLVQEEQNQLGKIPTAFPEEMVNSERPDIRQYVADCQKNLEKLIASEKKKALSRFDRARAAAKADSGKEAAKAQREQEQAARAAEQERLKNMTPEEREAEKAAAKAKAEQEAKLRKEQAEAEAAAKAKAKEEAKAAKEAEKEAARAAKDAEKQSKDAEKQSRNAGATGEGMQSSEESVTEE